MTGQPLGPVDVSRLSASAASNQRTAELNEDLPLLTDPFRSGCVTRVRPPLKKDITVGRGWFGMAHDVIAVLVVEDETLIRMDITTLLEDQGFTVYEAADADEAIAILNTHSEIRAMFTDIDMPGTMDGLKLAAAVRDRWPPVQIIVTSGHRQLRDDQLPVQGRFFSKPYDHLRVSSAIREMVAAE